MQATIRIFKWRQHCLLATAMLSIGVFAAAPPEVAFRAGGALEFRQHGRPHAELAFFLWTNDWIYGQMDEGGAQADPKHVDDLTVEQRGQWTVRGQRIPVDWKVTLRAKGSGYQARLEVRRTAAVDLTDGVWCRLAIPRAYGRHRQLRFLPGSTGEIGRSVMEKSQGLVFQIDGHHACNLAFSEAVAVRSRVDGDTDVLEIKLFGDLPLNETQTRQIDISFPEQSKAFEIVAPTAPTLGEPRVLTANPKPHEVVEIAIDTDPPTGNPYDPEDVEFHAEIRSPNGQTRTQSGFYMEPYQRVERDGEEFWQKQTKASWRLRFTPDQPGEWQISVHLRQGKATMSATLPALHVVNGNSGGFVRVADNKSYLQLANGDPLIPIGFNRPIYPLSGESVEACFATMQAHGENCLRLWMSRESLGIEWESTLGRYRQSSAAKFDHLLTLAAQYGIYLIVCFDTHQDFQDAGWAANPYNTRNGGPCRNPASWFTSMEARRHYQNRLRYIVARWAAYPQILAWEMGNEFEGWFTSSSQVIAWHRQMTSYLRRIDPYQHLITTSWWTESGPAATWQLPDIDIVQVHYYANEINSVAMEIQEMSARQRRFGKPFFFGEFGTHSAGPPTKEDPEGWSLHNGLWAGLASGALGAPMPWWYDRWISPHALHRHYQALKPCHESIGLGQGHWRPITPATVEHAERPPLGTITLVPMSGQRVTNERWHEVASDGSLTSPQLLPELLYGEKQVNNAKAVGFSINFVEAGEFVISLGRVSKRAHVEVYVDDELQLSRDLPAGPGFGVGWAYHPTWRVWRSDYQETLRIPVQAGRRRIRVRNQGDDWVRVNHYRFTNCKPIEPTLTVMGMQTDDRALLWVYNESSNWYRHAHGLVQPVAPTKIRLHGLTPGTYELVRWNTFSGESNGKTLLTTNANGHLTLALPELATDVALTLRLQ